MPMRKYVLSTDIGSENTIVNMAQKILALWSLIVARRDVYGFPFTAPQGTSPADTLIANF